MTIFEKIIAGEIPGHFVWKDDVCVAFATIEPYMDGHLLVVPREPVAQFTDLDPDIFAHLAKVCQVLGNAQKLAFGCPRVVSLILGFEVPHVHIHLIPAWEESVVDPSNAYAASAAELAAAMEKIREALRQMNRPEVANGSGV